MSEKLKDFVRFISSEHVSHDDVVIGNYVSWLRRRVGLLKNAETKSVIEIIRSCQYQHISKNEMIFKQGTSRLDPSQSQFVIVLGGAVSVFVNPFLTGATLRRGSTNSLERAILGMTFKNSTLPKSASSKRTTNTLYAPLTEQPESEHSDAESEESVHLEKTGDDIDDESNQSTPLIVSTDEQLHVPTVPPSPKSKSSKRSTREMLRSKLGNFVVKYDKGKSFDEGSITDINGIYSASVIADDDTDIILVPQDIFDKYIKEHHEKETMTLSNFVDIHPFFRHLPVHAQGMIQISLKNQQIRSGSYIVRQGDPINKLIFLVRESRRRLFTKQYEYNGEVSRRWRQKETKSTKTEFNVCVVQSREVIGIAEILFDLSTHMDSIRCIEDCEIYTLGLRPFRRLIKRKHPEVMKLVRKYVQMKLSFRLESSIGEQVPLFRCLNEKLADDIKDTTYKKLHRKSMEQKEEAMMRLLNYFKLNKSPLVKDLNPSVVDLREQMKEKAKIRESIRERTKLVEGTKQYHRRGCLATVKQTREPQSLYKLRDPMNGLIARLKMEGTIVTEEDLEDLLCRYSVTPVDFDVSTKSRRVIDEDYKLFRYRRYGNRLVKNFTKMIDRHDPRYLLGIKEATTLSTGHRDETMYTNNDDESELPILLFEDDMKSYTDDIDSNTMRTRPTTFKSLATTDTYKTLQFERRVVTPKTLDMRIKDFHIKFGGNESVINTLPSMKVEREHGYDNESIPKPGGKVFVTTLPCMSCIKNVQLKDHSHIRCQMLNSLPMHKVKGFNRY
ncbi:hypothetical protein ACF0H5_018560 [Mactra antiquata]